MPTRSRTARRKHAAQPASADAQPLAAQRVAHLDSRPDATRTEHLTQCSRLNVETPSGGLRELFTHWLGVLTQQVLTQLGEVLTQCLHSDERFRSVSDEKTQCRSNVTKRSENGVTGSMVGELETDTREREREGLRSAAKI